jgi:hypothetical protein
MSNKDIYQQVFNTAVSKTIEQGKQSYNKENDTCMYRFNGLKCVVGHLLSDAQIAKYRVHDRMTPAKFEHDLIRELCPGVDSLGDASRFLQDLQFAHDSASSGESFSADFKKRANEVAAVWDLEPIA